MLEEQRENQPGWVVGVETGTSRQQGQRGNQRTEWEDFGSPVEG